MQGPVGYTPVCQCGPALHHLEKTMHQTKEQLYEHIDASHQVTLTLLLVYLREILFLFCTTSFTLLLLMHCCQPYYCYWSNEYQRYCN